MARIYRCKISFEIRFNSKTEYSFNQEKQKILMLMAKLSVDPIRIMQYYNQTVGHKRLKMKEHVQKRLIKITNLVFRDIRFQAFVKESGS